jgi:hypothetical protein
MKLIRTALAALALISISTPAIAQNVQPVKTIVIDNRAPCFGGKIGEAREWSNAMTARALAKDLRKEGYKVRVITLSPGFDQSIPTDNYKTFTSPC